MKYVKQHFVTGMKVSLPDVLNRMEDGIAADAWGGRPPPQPPAARRWRASAA